MTTNYEAQMDRIHRGGEEEREREVITGSTDLMDTLAVSLLHGEGDQVSPGVSRSPTNATGRIVQSVQ